MKKEKLLIASTSTVYGTPYLEYITDEISDFFKGINEITFIPFAQPSGISYDEYTALASGFFSNMGISIRGIHEYLNVSSGLNEAQAIFTGGGNTFLLLKSIYDHGLLDLLKSKIMEGCPYFGTSAGSNILGRSIQTTNDMPIVFPPSFSSIGAVPFNLNPHYIDANPNTKHMGETRDTRIQEFLAFNDIPVIGLREGSYLRVTGNDMALGGPLPARIFEKNMDPYEIKPGSDFTLLLNR